MAAAEARAVWQRAANRCFVQEDAKRAPKLACCQSSSSSSRQPDGGPTGAADVLDHPAAGIMPLNRNPSYSNLPPDTRWWLQLQPSYGYQKGLTYEQLNAMEAEMENLETQILNFPSKTSDKDSTCIDGNKSSEPSLDAHGRISANHSKKDPDVRKQEVKSFCNKSLLEFTEPKGIRENQEMDNFGCPKFQKSNDYCFDPVSPWIASEKNVPWWRTTDKDDLAFMVAQKSLNYFENCDLPPPQKMHVKRNPCSCPGSSDHSDMLASSLDFKVQAGYVSSSIVHVQGCPNFERMPGGQRASSEGNSQSVSDKLYRNTTTQKDSTGNGQVPEKDPCKAQLLEALCHSQTRAREAEKIAKQACADKDDLIKLVFRQASQLFAYKQWFQLLQLESLYNKMKNSDQPISTLCPPILPWTPQKGRKLRKNSRKSKGKQGKCDRPKHDMSRYAIAFALGLSLVGAGLLLGWTVGWMLPF